MLVGIAFILVTVWNNAAAFLRYPPGLAGPTMSGISSGTSSYSVRRQQGAHRKAGARRQQVVGPQCTEEEMAVLTPVDQLTDKIEGKMSLNETITKIEKPPECEYAQRTKTYFDRETCFAALGFSFGIAKCWATADLERYTHCAYICQPYDQKHKMNFKCQLCIAQVNHKRDTCTYQYMGINDACAKCKLDVKQYFIHACKMQCLYAEDNVNDQDAIVACRQCTNDADNKALTCTM